VISFALVVLAPTAFWVGAIGGVSSLVGLQASPALLIAAAAAIGLFLFVIWAALIHGRSAAMHRTDH
jgi:hypothetical protein